MITSHASLVADLRIQVRTLEADLLPRATKPPFNEAIRAEWRAAREASRTSADFEEWLSEQVTQVAVAWVLGTVFVRFCEDNGLIELPVLSGPGDRLDLAVDRQRDFFERFPEKNDRDWIAQGFEAMSVSPVARGLFESHNPMWSILPSQGASKALLSFWRTTGPDGSVVHDFTDPEWDTRFLGNLYQDLSENARKKYALLQTPEFVEEFILDYTLDPAIEEFGLEPAPPIGHEHLPRQLRVIDPACGSGHFLLGAFHRLLAAWQVYSPAVDQWVLISRALSSVHGVDKNPFAVAIARFRLMIAAMKETGATRLTEKIDFHLNIAVGDSLLHGKGASGTPAPLEFDDDQEPCTYSGEDIDKFIKSVSILEVGTYHAIFTNPPYITPKDKAESEAYRHAYPDVIGTYSLVIPFIVRSYSLGVRVGISESGSGYIGMLVSNSFMKREFGRSLIEHFFPQIDLTGIVDTSGVFIPGHGTPTVMLLGRSRKPRTATVRAAISLQGEPSIPHDPALGLAWQSIVRGARSAPYRDAWTQVLDLDRSQLARFPWNFSDVETSAILQRMESGSRLGGRVARIGYFANTGADDVFVAPQASFRRIGAESELQIPVITGSEVRNWCVQSRETGVMFRPTGENDVKQRFPVHLRRLWPYRAVLENRRNYTGHSYREDGRPWYGWHHITDSPDTHPWSIIFSWVSTHNHFSILREHAAPLNSAPAIHLPSTASDSDVMQLTALLNSSLACFWLKQYSNSKGQPRADQTGTGEPWTLFYEFTGTRLTDFPLPPDRWSGDRWSVHAADIDQTAQEIASFTPHAVLSSGRSSPQLRLRDTRARWLTAHARLMYLQEELDWEIYERYGLISDEGIHDPDDFIPEFQAGERAFEIVLARRVASGEVTTTWFDRHGIAPITEIPSHWPTRYRQVVANRIRLIEEHPSIGIAERPEFKRRWEHETWQSQEREAIRLWLLDRCENRSLWYGPDGRPCLMTASRLADQLRVDSDFVQMARMLTGSDTDLKGVIKDITADQCVPYLAKLRYRIEGMLKHLMWERTWNLQREEDSIGERLNIPVPPKYKSSDFVRQSYWRNRGKLDVPNERFISYPPVIQEGEQLLGWAGWDHSDRARVLVDLIEAQKRDSSDQSETLIPLLTGLQELMFWLRQGHSGDRDEVQDYLQRELRRRGLSESDLDTWNPPEPKRGRPRKLT